MGVSGAGMTDLVSLRGPSVEGIDVVAGSSIGG